MKPSIWTGLYSEVPLPEAIRTLHGHGWQVFEVSTEHLVYIDSGSPSERQQQLNAVRAVCGELSVAIPQAHAYLQANLAAEDSSARESDIAVFERHLDICAELGVSIVVMHAGTYPSGSDDSTVARVHQQNLDAFRRLGKKAAALGLRIGLENLMTPAVCDPQALLELIDEIGGDAFGVTLDTSHANVMGLSIPEMIHQFGPRLIATHISENDGSRDQHRTPGGGTIDWPPIMRGLAEAGYTGTFNLEIPGERHRNADLREINSRQALEVARHLIGQL